MQHLIQIIYISRSTFASMAPQKGIEPTIARILAKSRANNRKNGLVGVLYFGDDCFFQCLEGEQGAVDTLYAKLEGDERHKDLKLISRKTIDVLSFSDWAMKYVPIEKQMQALLRSHGLNRFDPYRFSAELTRSVINLLQAASPAAEPEEAPALAGPTSSLPKQAGRSPSAGKLPLITLLIGIAVLVAGIIVLLRR